MKTLKTLGIAVVAILVAVGIAWYGILMSLFAKGIGFSWNFIIIFWVIMAAVLAWVIYETW